VTTTASSSSSSSSPSSSSALPSRAPTIEQQIEDLVSYEEPGCLCCKRFFCHDERNVSTDDLILEKDRLNLRQLLNHEAYKVGGNFQEQDDAREAKQRSCRKVLAEAAISVNCLKLPFAQFGKLSPRKKAGVIFVQSIWVSFLVLWFSVNKYERYNCHAHPLMRPGQDYTYEKYHCLAKSGYFKHRNSSQSEFEVLVADTQSGWNRTTGTLAEFDSWKKRTKFNGPVEYMEIITTLCDRAISVAAMYMFHAGTYTEALYPPMLDETFFPGAGTHMLAVRRPRKYIQQVRPSHKNTITNFRCFCRYIVERFLHDVIKVTTRVKLTFIPFRFCLCSCVCCCCCFSCFCCCCCPSFLHVFP
jgi:hypothetical protein